jgi:hypothetical protein
VTGIKIKTPRRVIPPRDPETLSRRAANRHWNALIFPHDEA